jgi:26S proteasome regulatory subunit T3
MFSVQKRLECCFYVSLKKHFNALPKISAADIASMAQEAGLHAVRNNRYVILPADMEKAYKNNVKKADTDFEFYT